MPYVAFEPGDIVEVRACCWLPARAQLGVNVTHHLVIAGSGGLTTSVEMDLAAVDLAAALDGPYLACLSEEAVYLGVEIQRRWPSLSVSGFGGGSEAVGLATGGVLPGQVTGLIRWGTDLPGRSGRGRIYVPFPPTGANEIDGRPDGTYIGALQNLADFYAALVGIGDGTNNLTTAMGVFSPTLEDWNIVGSWTGMGSWATQRRRGMYGSVNDLPAWAVLP